jgi:hypothetical protein
MELLVIALASLLGLCLIWAIIATILAVQGRNNAQSQSAQLAVANAGLDNCLSYCGSPGQWASGQLTRAGTVVNAVLKGQNRITCTDPGTAYPLLTTCTVNQLAQSQSYWTIVDPNKAAIGANLINTALVQCVGSGKVPGCKLSS